MRIRRKTLKVFAMAGALGPAGVLGLISQALAMGRIPTSSGVYKVRGQVTVNGKAAQLGQKIGPGDTVVTGPDSEVVFVIGADAFLQRDRTTLVFGVDTVKEFFRVVTGRVLSVFGKTEKLRTLSTKTATIGIRGTGCYIEEEGQGTTARTYFCLCFGSVDLTPVAAPQQRQSYSTHHHDRPMYVYNDPEKPHMMAPAGVNNHTDAELTMLEALVGRKPPFYGEGGIVY